MAGAAALKGGGLGPALLALGLLAACTATTLSAVTRRLPPGLSVEEALVLETDYLSCTFAELRIAPGFAPDPRAVRQTFQALTRLDAAVPFQHLRFPDRGFALFPGRSAVEVSGDLRSLGAEDLSDAVAETIWRAKACWRDHIDDRSLADDGAFWRAIGDDSGVVILGGDWPPTVAVAFPDRNLAYYLGP